MDIISSIAELCKEKEELEETVDRYEDWFSDLIGKTITVTHGTARHKKFTEMEIVSFDIDGWTAIDEDENEFLVTWNDIVRGRVVIHTATQ